MSMQDTPATGYVLEAHKAILLLKLSDRIAAELIYEDDNSEGLQDYLEKNLPCEFPRPAEVFILSDEDTSEDLERGQMYVRWDEEELYIRTDTPAMKAIRNSLGEIPKPALWTVWG